MNGYGVSNNGNTNSTFSNSQIVSQGNYPNNNFNHISNSNFNHNPNYSNPNNNFSNFQNNNHNLKWQKFNYIHNICSYFLFLD